MDLLENYKKAWNNQPEDAQLSAVEIYKIAHSKSSSIVKWIFIMGLLEFVFWITINLTIPDSYYKIYEDLNLMDSLNIFMFFHYAIIIIFLYLFYKNYKKISLVDSTHKLMGKILRIRKTVKYYVFYNIGSVFLVAIVFNVIMFSDTEKLNIVMNPSNLSLDMSQIITVAVISQLIVFLVIILFFWLFYKLVYGILLNKLTKNYKNLLKLDTID